jgi:hypothetical protein
MKKMITEESEKIIARVDTPDFKKYPLISLSVGGGDKWFGYTRGENYGVFGILGIYISFRLPYQSKKVYGDGVQAGFDAAAKTVAYLIKKVNEQAIMINSLKELIETIGDEIEDEDDEDDNGFKPNWN